MKKIIIAIMAILIVAVFTSCMDGTEYLAKQSQCSSEVLYSISPEGLEFDKPCGKNWWYGSYKGKPVVIHAEVTSRYVNVDFEYLEENK